MAANRGIGMPGEPPERAEGAARWRELLPATYGAFLSGFDALRPIQIEGMPPILAGQDVLLCSATASGKTEAYAAPAAQMVCSRSAGPVHVVIVSPTRALANDLYRRLQSKMETVGVTLGRRTGEYKETVDGALPQIIITTPESLDSLIARRPQTLRGTRLVILDEIHVLDGSPRGDQLRVLLHRLEQVVEVRPQRVAASATIDDPKGLAARYMTPDAVIVSVPGSRLIGATEFEGKTSGAIAIHLDRLAENRFRKILVFCNSRAATEDLSGGVRNQTRFRDAIYTHHGSLSRGIRERAESQFLNAPAAVCFATMTLEMGIDIGTVDYVLLADRPADVPALLQRIGRGSRRSGKTRAGYCTKDPVDAFLFKVMFQAAVRGQLLTAPCSFRPSVLVQQALTLAGANGSVTAADLHSTLPPDLHSSLDEESLASLLDQMVETERLEPPRRGNYVLSTSSEARYKRGSLHSNISDSPSTSIIDRITGDIIGTVEQAESPNVKIGGANRKLITSSSDRLLTDQTKQQGTSRFTSRGFPTIALPLARRIVESTGLPPNQVIQFLSGTDHILLHGFGIFGSLLLAAHLPKTSRLIRTTPYSLRLAQPLLSLPKITLASATTFIHSHEPRLTSLTQPGPFHSDLPDSLRLPTLTSLLNLPSFLTYYNQTTLSSFPLTSLSHPETAEALG